MIERWLFFRSKDDGVGVLAAEADAYALAAGSRAAALEALRPLRSLAAAIARAGLGRPVGTPFGSHFSVNDSRVKTPHRK